MRFCVMRHPQVGTATSPESAWDMYRAQGWYRVSQWRDGTDFNPADYPDDAPDLDADPEPKQKSAPRKAAAKSTEEED